MSLNSFLENISNELRNKLLELFPMTYILVISLNILLSFSFCRYMNIVMKDCVFTDPRGDSFKYDMFFIQARNIRSVHVPMNVSALKSFSPLSPC